MSERRSSSVLRVCQPVHRSQHVPLFRPSTSAFALRPSFDEGFLHQRATEGGACCDRRQTSRSCRGGPSRAGGGCPPSPARGGRARGDARRLGDPTAQSATGAPNDRAAAAGDPAVRRVLQRVPVAAGPRRTSRSARCRCSRSRTRSPSRRCGPSSRPWPCSATTWSTAATGGASPARSASARTPCQICHEWNTVAHAAEYEGRPGNRPLTREELQAFFNHADDQVVEAERLGRKGWVAAFRDAALFKVIYALGAAPPGGGHASTSPTSAPTRPRRSWAGSGCCRSAGARRPRAARRGGAMSAPSCPGRRRSSPSTWPRSVPATAATPTRRCG